MKLFLNDPNCSQQGCPKLGRNIKAELEYILFPPQDKIESREIREGLDRRMSRTLDSLIKESERRDVEEVILLEGRVNKMLSVYGVSLYDKDKFEKKLEGGKVIYIAKDQSSPVQRVMIRNKGLIRWITKAFKTIGYDNKHEDDLSGINIIVYDELHPKIDLYQLAKDDDIEEMKETLKLLLSELNAFHGKPSKFEKWFKNRFGRLSKQNLFNMIKVKYEEKYDPFIDQNANGVGMNGQNVLPVNGSGLPNIVNEDMLVGDGISASWFRSMYSEFFIDDLVKVGSYMINYRNLPVSVKSQEAIDLDNARNHLIYDIMLFGYHGREIDQDISSVQSNPDHMFVRTAREYFNEKFKKKSKYQKIPLRGDARRKAQSKELGVDKVFCFIDNETGKKNLAALKGNAIIRYEEKGNMSQTGFIDQCSEFLKISFDKNKFNIKEREQDGLAVANMLPSQNSVLAHNMIVYSNEEPVGWLFQYPLGEIDRVKRLAISPKFHFHIDNTLTTNFLGYFKDYRLNPKENGYRAYQAKEFGEREIRIMTPLDFYEAELGRCAHETYSSRSDEKAFIEKIMRYCKKIVNDKGGKFTSNKQHAVKNFIDGVFKQAVDKYEKLLYRKLADVERSMAYEKADDVLAVREEFTLLYQRFCREMPSVTMPFNSAEKIDKVILK